MGDDEHGWEDVTQLEVPGRFVIRCSCGWQSIPAVTTDAALRQAWEHLAPG